MISRINIGNKIKVSSAFTIVELLIVIVVIGVLAAISLVSYTGISKRAVVSALSSDLTSASRQLQMYQTIYGSFPSELDANYCPVLPNVDDRYCLKTDSSYTFSNYAYDNTASPKIFSLEVSDSNGVTYHISDSGSPVVATQTRASCLDILNAGESNGDGLYWINPSGSEISVLCDMTTDSGGWTRVGYESTAISDGWSDVTITDAVVNGVPTKVHGMYAIGDVSEKVFDLNNIAHSQVRIQGRYYAIDSWDNEVDGAQVWVDGVLVWTQSHYYTSGGPGGGWVDITFSPSPWIPASFQTEPVEGYWNIQTDFSSIGHSANMLTLGFNSNLNQATSDESYAFSHVGVWIR